MMKRGSGIAGSGSRGHCATGARRVCRGLLIWLVAATWFWSVQAAARNIYLAPKISYAAQDYHVGSTSPLFDSLDAVIEYKKQEAQQRYRLLAPNVTTVDYVNLRVAVDPRSLNGIPLFHQADLFTCKTDGSCHTDEITGKLTIITVLACPDNQIFPDGSTTPVRFSSTQTNYPEPYKVTEICIATLPDTEPCDGDCRGNGIHTGTGQKVQADIDYGSATGGLQFQRTYRSTQGLFISPAASALTDYSVPNVLSEHCYPGTYSAEWWGYDDPRYYQSWLNYHSRTDRYNHCFNYTTKPTGEQRYELTTPDGRIITFTGPPDAITAKADVNDKLSRRVNSAGAIEWVAQRADDSTEIYDAKGHLIRTTSLGGGDDVSYAYSDAGTPTTVAPRAGLLIRMSDRFGRQLNFTYDARSRMTGMTDPAGGTYQYAYDDNAKLSSVTYPDGKVRAYHYNEAAHLNNGAACSGLPHGLPHALTGITDENGTRFATYKYDCKGRAVSTERAGGVDKYSFTYPNTRTTVEVDPLGTTRTYNFQETLSVVRLTGTTQPAPTGTGTVSTSLAYDARGNVASRTDFNGNVTTYTYDSARNLETSRTEAVGSAQARTITTQWHPTYRLPTLITEPGRTTAFTYDSAGNPLTKTLTAGGNSRTWATTYNSLGQILTVTGPRTDIADITRYTYDSGGNLGTITNALGHVTTLTNYDPNGRVGLITDPDGATTALSYSPRGWLTGKLVTAGNIVQSTGYRYDGVGQLTKVTLPDGSTIDYTYDPAHRLTAIADGLGNRIAYTLDPAGNRIGEAVTDPDGALTSRISRVHDALNRLTQVTGAAQQTTRYEYDANGNRTRITDPLNRITAHQYDALNRLVRTTDPNNGVTQYGYNALDQLTQVTDPRNLATRYTLDGLGNQTALNSPDTGNTGHTFDAAGNLLTRTDAKGQTTTYQYDALHRVTRTSHADGNVIDYQYDQGAYGIGRLSRITDATGSTQYGYGPHGRVTSEVRTIGNQAHTTGYRYDNIGRLSGMTYPTGRSIDYTRDSLGRISRIDTTKDGVTQPIVTQVRYQPFGPANTVTYGNGQSYRRSYDLDGRTASYTLNGQAQTISYDAAGRITAIDGPDIPNGINAVNSNYTYGTTSNRLTHITGSQAATIVTDPNGNITGKGANQFSYDARNRMVSATTPGGTVQYRINGLGQRVQKITPSRSTVFHYDQGGKLIAETSGQTGIDYVYLGDMPVAVGDGAARVYFIHSDHLNSPRMITDANNNVVWEWENSEPFGNNLPNQNPSGLGVFEFNKRFDGQYFDSETGLHQNWHRDFDPATGRYIESDRLGLAGGSLSTYTYADNNPLSKIDPTGEIAIALPWIIPPAIEAITYAATAAGAAWAAHELTKSKDQCENDDRCNKAKQDAQSRYQKLVNKRIPQYLTGGTNGPDANHYKSILQLQDALKDAIRRVRLYCNPLPPELTEWERAANQFIPPQHGG